MNKNKLISLRELNDALDKLSLNREHPLVKIFLNQHPLVKFDSENLTIDLATKLHENGRNYLFRSNPYWIPLSRIDTPLKLLHWISHLSGKTWFTREHTYQLIMVWSETLDQKIPHV